MNVPVPSSQKKIEENEYFSCNNYSLKYYNKYIILTSSWLPVRTFYGGFIFLVLFFIIDLPFVHLRPFWWYCSGPEPAPPWSSDNAWGRATDLRIAASDLSSARVRQFPQTMTTSFSLSDVYVAR